MDVQDPSQYDEYIVPRNSAHECVSQIVDDLDEAIKLLPPEWPGHRGKITRAGAAALKGRVLLFYASPQFNPDNLNERWEQAYAANIEAKDLAEEDGYALYSDYANIFLAEEEANEALFITVFNDISKSHSYETSVRPRSVAGDNNNAVSSPPNWDFVKSYSMYDGRPIEGHPEYDSVRFWQNRDPRFYATIAYNGMIWDFAGTEGRRQWTYLGNIPEPNETSKGASPTGFYLKKNVDTAIPTIDILFCPTDWIEIRLAEVYLNLAECAAELNKLDEARELIVEIRKRAGIQEGDGSYGLEANTKAEMVAAVMLERKIELAFENKRHWDLRRRNMYINDLNGTSKINGTRRHGLETILDTAFIHTIDPGVRNTKDSAFIHFEYVMMDTLDLDIYYDDFFDSKVVELDETDINFLQPKYNFYDIPQDQLQRNPSLKQTIYWTEVDPFDPLAEQ